MPALIREVGGISLAEAAIWGGTLTTVFAVFQFLCAPTVGNLSDRFGRRPVLFVSLFILALDYLVMAVAGSIWLLLLGRIVGGITSATQSVANAFIADITRPEDKAARFGLAGAAFGVGFVLGPLIGGVLGELGTRAPFYAAAALAAMNLVFGLIVLPETVTDRIRRPFEWRRANPLGAFRAVANLPGIGWLVVMFFLYQVAFTVYPAIWAYFTQARLRDRHCGGPGRAHWSFDQAYRGPSHGLVRLGLQRAGFHRHWIGHKRHRGPDPHTAYGAWCRGHARRPGHHVTRGR
jgi:DHA1 family tetracycline resistance protein-like MFS transporter